MRRRALLAAAGTAGASTLAGCGLVPEDADPLEASATAPATLPTAAAADAGYEAHLAETTTVETTVTADVSGDVELSARREVVMTLFRRGYRDPDAGRWFGLLTAPAVRLIGNSETRYDPVPALDATRVVRLATGRVVDAVSDGDDSGTVTLLGTETTRETGTVTVDDDEAALVRARARAGTDAVTGVAVAPTADAVVAPFASVERKA